MKRKALGLLVVTGMVFGVLETRADGALLGADAFIACLRENMDAGPAVAKPAEDPALSAYRKNLAAFKAGSAAMTPEQAADGWLALAAQYWTVPAESDPASFYSSSLMPPSDKVSFPGLLAAIPGPDAWPLIQAKLEATPAAGNPAAPVRQAVLMAAVARLNQDPARLQKALESLDQQAGSLERYQRDSFKDLLRDLREESDRLAKKGLDPVEALEKELRKTARDDDRDKNLDMPDLVSMIGAPKTEPLILKAFKVSGLRLEIEGRATRDLARKLAVDNLKSLSCPQWGLVDPSAEGSTLFAALVKKFGMPKTDEELEAEAEKGGETDKEPPAGWNGYGFRNDFEEARIANLMGLLLQNKPDEALKAALAIPEEDLNSCDFSRAWKDHASTPSNRVLADFLGRWLEAKPELPIWNDYGSLASLAGMTEQAFDLQDRMMKRSDLTAIQRFRISHGKATLLLARDRVEEGVALLRSLAAVSVTNELPAIQKQLKSGKSDVGEELARLGFILDNADWVKEGIALCEANGESPYSSFPSFIAKEYLKKNRYSEAEERIWRSITNTLSAARMRSDDKTPVDLSSAYAQLIPVYLQAGRPADVLALFEKAPGWGSATNLSDLSLEFHAPAAAALHAAGRDGEAWTILTRHLLMKGGDDEAYKILLEIPGHDTAAFLDSLYARDRFEERPLIWKAAILLKGGRLEEADATARQALKVDPTDGEEPEGDRVRGYAVLADILAARGKADDAAFFRKVVRSVRIAEEGDDLGSAGLTARSLKRYEEASTYFADAYCVQWRLAERLQALGKTEEAQAHYQLAFERMPEQFGQVASLCFGCMGVFDNPESRGAAEVVLTRLATNTPVRPPVFYLLGQLREEQGRFQEAYAHYRKAVELDPGYLDVWQKIVSLRDKIQLPDGEWDDISLAILRLDPLQRHACLGKDIMDLRKLWPALADSWKLGGMAEESPSLLVLKASLAAQPKEENDRSGMRSYRSSSYYYTRYGRYGRRIPPPGEALTERDFFRQLDRVQECLNLSARGQGQGMGMHPFVM